MEENQSSIKETLKQCRVSNEMYENVHYSGKIYHTAWEVEDLPICSNEGDELDEDITYVEVMASINHL